jgi:hypothetical protein
LRVSQASQRWILSRFYHGNIKTEELGAWELFDHQVIGIRALL